METYQITRNGTRQPGKSKRKSVRKGKTKCYCDRCGKELPREGIRVSITIENNGKMFQECPVCRECAMQLLTSVMNSIQKKRRRLNDYGRKI